MRRIGPVIAAAALASASAAFAQSETELYQENGSAMLAAQREVTQHNIELASQALQAGDFKTARKYALSVTRADPKRVEPWLMLGAAQAGLEDWKAARSTYATAVRISPGDPTARGGLGVAMAKTRDPYATVQLAWLAAKVQACGGCGQAAQLAKLHSDVEAAILEANKPVS
jgi:cytochrome c-type biogenesis protein CcmH/NrfG